ncbi:hypothetical protein FOZ60_003988 [Perkinsus olseni]|uniref:Enoyl reductase (ER) domain-containing protein n=1 Tax=Perkinsus olseni TaxID=32597 RepID=A0A7J6NV21_PEROL|nr:hypothetical protein FOZ60_003988 [Perkinsus olseni]
MKAFVYSPDDGSIVPSKSALSIPKPSAGQVQVKVIAAGVNPVDVKFPNIPIVGKTAKGRAAGFDFAGEVTIGSGEYKKGDLVYGVARQGSFCEYTVADVSRIARIPKGMSPVVAASLPIATLVSLQALKQGGVLAPGKSVLIIGASGGTGASAVQIAKAHGAKVYAVCSGRNADYVKSLGADVVLDYTKDGFQLPNDQCPAGTVDMVYDCVVAPGETNYEPTARQTLTKEGMYIGVNGSEPDDWLAYFIEPRVPFPVQRPNYSVVLVQVNTEELVELTSLVTAGKLKVDIQELPLTDEGIDTAVKAIRGRRIRDDSDWCELSPILFRTEPSGVSLRSEGEYQHYKAPLHMRLIYWPLSSYLLVMKACIYRPDDGEIIFSKEDMPVPQPSDGQVQVKVLAASINPVDLGLPHMPIVKQNAVGRPAGFDFAGEVTIGSGEYKKGDLVYGVARQGSFCEYTVADVSRIARIPKGMSPVVAASLPIASLASLQALKEGDVLASGKNVLILGASGGTGASAVQIAKAHGAKVYAVCSGRNADYVKSLGADVVLDYTKDGFQLPNGQCPADSMDAALDCVKTPNYEPSARKVLKKDANYVALGSDSLTDRLAYFIEPLVPFPVQRPNYRQVLVQVNTEELNELSSLVISGSSRLRSKSCRSLSRVALQQ